MKSLVLAGLVIFNVLLVGLLVMRHVPDNRAQAAFNGVSAAEILAVPGTLAGFPNGVIWLLDGRSGLLTAISYDAPSGNLTWLQRPIDISQQLTPGNGRNGR
jgi:hypothetical protein